MDGLSFRKTLCALAMAFLASTALGQTQSDTKAVSSGLGGPEKQVQAFVLSPGDVIELKFFYNAELNDSFQIRPDGHLTLPLVGEVQLAGKTVADAIKALTTLYEPHLKNPGISIIVRVFASQKVYVGGEVVRPGVISLATEMHVFDAIMEAGGIKLTGKNNTVILLRKRPDGGRTTQLLRLREKTGAISAEANLALQPFDVILVPETKIARVDRWVDQHLRQTVPVVVTAGFSYLFNAQVVQ